MSRRAIALGLSIVLLFTVLSFLPSEGSAAVVTPSFQTSAAPGASSAGEPSIGVNPATGILLFQSGPYTLSANLSSWPPVWSFAQSPFSAFNIDPILSTDRDTGRTWAGGLNGQCSVLSFTDDDGASWTPTGNACASPSYDHETIGAGPYAGAPSAGATYSHIVYYCAQEGIAQCATSSNGGLTFGPGVPISCGGLHGHVKVARDGTAYVPSKNCGGATVSVSTNNGIGWTARSVPGATAPGSGFDPSVALSTNGTAYLAWQNGNNHPYAAASKDRGAHWLNVTDLSTTWSPPLVTSTFQAAVAGDDDRAAVAFLGSTTGGNPFASSWNGVWDLYVSFTYNGGGSWTTVKATTDPVQRGWMCAAGLSCGPGRNLLDFMDATIDAKGHVIVGFADGCIGTCATGSGSSTSAQGTIAVQTGGSGVYAAFDPAAAVAPVAPVLSGTPRNTGAAISWTTPTSNGGPITGYEIWRGTSSGGESLLTTLGVTNAYVDTGLTNGATYYYQVKAVNAVGSSAASNEVALVPVGTPGAPPYIQVAPAGTVALAMSIGWQAPTNTGASAITNYTLYRGTSSGGETFLVKLGNTTTYIDNGVSQGVTYYYYVTATNAQGEGVPSAEDSGHT